MNGEPGDREARRNVTGETPLRAELVVYHDDFCEDVRQQLMNADGALVWVNPMEGGRDRSVLDAMLRDVAASGVFVSTHPDVILKLRTKEILRRTCDMGWGCDTHLYDGLEQMMRGLPSRLADGKAPVREARQPSLQERRERH